MRFPTGLLDRFTLEARATGVVPAVPTSSKPAAKRRRSKRSAAISRPRTTVVMTRQGQHRHDRQPAYRPDLRTAPR